MSPKFTGKYLCWSLFLIKLQPSGLQLFCEFFENFKDIILQNIRFLNSQSIFSQNLFLYLWTNLFLVNTIPRISSSKDFILLLFVSNLWSIAFLKTAGVLHCCSFAASFQETIISMTESVWNKVSYVAKYKLHRRCFMLKFSEISMLACGKIFSAFYPILHETFSSSCGLPLKHWI